MSNKKLVMSYKRHDVADNESDIILSEIMQERKMKTTTIVLTGIITVLLVMLKLFYTSIPPVLAFSLVLILGSSLSYCLFSLYDIITGIDLYNRKELMSTLELSKKRLLKKTIENREALALLELQIEQNSIAQELELLRISKSLAFRYSLLKKNVVRNIAVVREEITEYGNTERSAIDERGFPGSISLTEREKATKKLESLNQELDLIDKEEGAEIRRLAFS